MFAFMAWLDSVSNHVVYSWFFAASILPMFIYGLPAVFISTYKRGAPYLSGGWIAIGVVGQLAHRNLANGNQVLWGMVFGWFAGVAVISLIMWLKLRERWNSDHPEKRC